MNLFQTIDNIKNIALTQPNIRTASEGNVYSIMNTTPDIRYGVFVITQGTHRSDDVFNYFNFNFFYVDRLVDDMESNRLQIQSIGIQMLNNILNTFADEYDIDLNSDIQYNPFTQKFADETAGVYCTITLEVPKDGCAESYVEKAPVKIYNQKINMTFTDNGEYNITYDKEIYTGIEEVNIIVNIDIEEQQAIGYQRGYTQGKDEGFHEGIEIGYNNGYDVGKSEGYSEGKTDGYNEGIEGAETTIAEEAVTLYARENRTYTTKYTGGEGNLIKQVNVEVQPKVSVKDGLKFGNSTYVTIPDYFDFNGVTNLERMFFRCYSLEEAPFFRTDMVTDFTSMFDNCTELKTIPLYDTSNATNMSRAFHTCFSIETIPPFNTSKLQAIDEMFGDCNNLRSIPPLDASSLVNRGTGLFSYSNLDKLTDFGGLINLKISLTRNTFERLPNLSYESCINIMNGLYDFIGNGETPNSTQGQLKVHQNFLDLVGDEISIAVNKGWNIYA